MKLGRSHDDRQLAGVVPMIIPVVPAVMEFISITTKTLPMITKIQAIIMKTISRGTAAGAGELTARTSV
jgi:hypothetical protein